MQHELTQSVMLFGAHTKLVGHRETCRFVCGSIAVYSACIDAVVAGKISQSFQEVSTITKLIFFFTSFESSGDSSC